MIKQRSQCNCSVTFCNQFSTRRSETSPSREANCLLLTCRMAKNFPRKHYFTIISPDNLLFHLFCRFSTFLHFRLKIWGGMGVVIDAFLLLCRNSRRSGAHMKIWDSQNWGLGGIFLKIKKTNNLCLWSDMHWQLSVIVLKYQNYKAKVLLILPTAFNLFLGSRH